MTPTPKHVRRRPAMAKWREHRDAVRETLKRRKKSVYWLHAQLAAHMSRTLVYEYVRGDVGISVENMQRINDVLGLRYTDE
jgi:predicted transcriptional regulator